MRPDRAVVVAHRVEVGRRVERVRPPPLHRWSASAAATFSARFAVRALDQGDGPGCSSPTPPGSSGGRAPRRSTLVGHPEALVDPGLELLGLALEPRRDTAGPSVGTGSPGASWRRRRSPAPRSRRSAGRPATRRGTGRSRRSPSRPGCRAPQVRAGGTRPSLPSQSRQAGGRAIQVAVPVDPLHGPSTSRAAAPRRARRRRASPYLAEQHDEQRGGVDARRRRPGGAPARAVGELAVADLVEDLPRLSSRQSLTSLPWCAARKRRVPTATRG